MKLLGLVSNKIYERFENLRIAFRYFDTDHNLAISLTEFAQAIEFLRIKISFEDVQKLFQYMDTQGKGEISYDEFTLLTEEKWRKLDPFSHYKKGKTAFKERIRDEKSSSSSPRNKDFDSTYLNQIESRGQNRVKIPLGPNKSLTTKKVEG